MTNYPGNDFDRDPTDELPVLTAAVIAAHDAEQDFENQLTDDTGEHTAAFGTLAAEALPGPPSDQTANIDLSNVTTLEAEVERWSARCRSAEERLAERDLRIADLDGTVATTRRLLADQRATAERRAAELKERTDALEASVAERARLREQLERAAAERTASSVPAAPGRGDASQQSGELQRLLEENAALVAYIGNRKQWWEKAQTEIATLATKVVALEHELARRTEQLARAESIAERDSQRASEFREQAVDLARQLRDRVQAAARSSPPLSVAPPPTAPIVEHSRSELAGHSSVGAPSVTSTGPAPLPLERRSPDGADALMHLEAEIEYKRQQVAAQLIELRERDARLQKATHDLEQARMELASSGVQLEEARSELARLQSGMAEQAHAVATRNATIAALQDELQLRIAALQKLNALDVSLQGLDHGVAERLGIGAGEDRAAIPTLLCLTGDAPARVTLDRATTFGRAPHCDVQILTHYVSREHARIVIGSDGAVIEDLGSRNGVFVNAARVARQRLHQGDLIKIGETQFRYVESMAH
jgi:hypothetical protein